MIREEERKKKKKNPVEGYLICFHLSSDFKISVVHQRGLKRSVTTSGRDKIEIKLKICDIVAKQPGN